MIECSHREQRKGGLLVLFAIIAGVVLQLGRVLWFWAVNWWILGAVVFVPGPLLTVVAVVLAIEGLLQRRLAAALFSLAITALSITAFFYIDYGDLTLHGDFAVKSWFLRKLAADAQTGSLTLQQTGAPAPGGFTEYRLDAPRRWLAADGEMFTSPSACGGRYVYFPTFFGVPDGTAGYLFVPACAKPSAFPGARFGAEWFLDEPLGGGWHYIAGS